MIKPNDEKGSALVTILLVVLLTSILGTALLTVTLQSHKSVKATENRTKTRYLAELGAKVGYWHLQQAFSQGKDISSELAEMNATPPTTPDPAKADETYEFRLTVVNERRSDDLYMADGYIEGTGSAQGKQSTVKINVHISNVPDVLNYAISASNTIWLNGGVKINGDIYAGDKLGLHQVAHYQNLILQHAVTSIYPEVNGKVSAGSAEKSNPAIYRIPNASLEVLSIPIPFTEEADSVGDHPIQDWMILDPNEANKYLNGSFTLQKAPRVQLPTIDFNQKGKQIKQLAVSDPSHYKYSAGDVTIHNGTLDNVSWFIDGNLEIEGNVYMNGTFYVTGSVTIQDIRSRNAIPACIIANGAIDVLHNNEYQPTPAILNAFLWSQTNDLVIYGVSSNIKINGGVIARNVILNGVRGATRDLLLSLFDQQTIQKDARLTINYDEKFITDPPRGIPTSPTLQVKQIGNWVVSN